MAKFVKKSNGSVTVIGRGKNGKTGIVGNLPKIPEPKTSPNSQKLQLATPEYVENLQIVKKKPNYDPDIVSLAEDIAKNNGESLDVHQVRNVLFFGGKSQNPKSFRKTQTVTEEEWEGFLNQTLLSAQNPMRGNPLTEEELEGFQERSRRLKSKYSSLSEEEKFNIMKLSSKLRHAHFALEREYVSVALFKKPSPSNEEVRGIINYHRQYYYSQPKDQRPEIPENYKRAFYRTMGIPKDNGTVYAFYKTETMKFNGGTYDAGAVFVAFDTETSGISTKDSEILQIGYGIYNSDGELLEKGSRYVKPEKVTESGDCYVGSEDAVAVHGITSDMVKNAPTFPEVWEDIAPKFQGGVVVGHNVGFDLKHLRNQFDQHNMVNSEGGKLSTSDVWWGEVDTLKHTQRHVEGTKDHKLTTLSEHYDIPLVNAHDAGDDAVAAGDLFFKIRETG